jgi:hypothetical protein
MPEIVDGFGRERQPLAAGLALSATRNAHRECSGGAVTTLVFCLFKRDVTWEKLPKKIYGPKTERITLCQRQYHRYRRG